jgi:nitroreductase
MNHPFQEEVEKVRHPKQAIHPLILDRWSPRSMTGESLSEREIKPLFEAARWAPSSYNNQPWRFLYARKETPSWPLFFDLMIEFNQKWTQNASALILIISCTHFKDNKPCRTHSFDTGAAWMALALEGASRGYVVHGMQGFDYEKARINLDIPDEFQVEAMAAVGKRAPASKLPLDLQIKEMPSQRKAIDEIVMEGRFKP